MRAKDGLTLPLSRAPLTQILTLLYCGCAIAEAVCSPLGPDAVPVWGEGLSVCDPSLIGRPIKERVIL